jgi:hypothetical protein
MCVCTSSLVYGRGDAGAPVGCQNGEMVGWIGCPSGIFFFFFLSHSLGFSRVDRRSAVCRVELIDLT